MHAAGRNDIQDVSGARLFEKRQKPAGKQQGAGHIAGNGVGDGIGIVAIHGAGKPLGGIIDENIKGRAVVAHFLGGKGGLADVSQINVKCFGPLAGAQLDRFGQRGEIFHVAAGHDHFGAGIGQHHGKCSAQAAPSASHNDAFPLEAHGPRP